MQSVDYIFKILLVGPQGVGKSSLMSRYVDQVYNDSYLSTIGVDFKIKTILVRNKCIKLQIWDTAGQERFQALTQQHFRGAHGCICVYDVTNPKSLDDAKRFLQIVIEENGINAEGTCLTANKIDLLARSVTRQQGQEVANSMGVNYVETSAKNDQNVQELFTQMAQSILMLVDQHKTNPIIPDAINQRLQIKYDTEQIQKKRCC